MCASVCSRERQEPHAPSDDGIDSDRISNIAPDDQGVSGRATIKYP